jgi:hypothetical protein
MRDWVPYYGAAWAVIGFAVGVIVEKLRARS